MITTTEISVHFDGMSWPRLNERYGELQWTLRYAQNRLTREDLFRAASILAAFDALVSKSQKDRNEICKNLKKAEAK